MDSKQQIKIDRRPWILSGILVIAVIWLLFNCFMSPVQTTTAPVQVTTVYIVRHAEKVDNSADPQLSAAGQERAKELAHVLGDEGIDAVFVTDFIRTRHTGAPVEKAAGVTARLYPANKTQKLIDMILADHVGKRILVVGHSNTVDDIAAGLGATGLSDLADDQYDRLFVVHRFADTAHLDRLRYGRKHP